MLARPGYAQVNRPAFVTGGCHRAATPNAQTAHAMKGAQTVAAHTARRGAPAAPGRAELVKLKPRRDDFGRVVVPARVWLHDADDGDAAPAAEAAAAVDGRWLARLAVGERIDLLDARAAWRRLTVVEIHAGAAVLECERSVHLVASTRLRVLRQGDDQPFTTVVALAAAGGTSRTAARLPQG